MFIFWDPRQKILLLGTDEHDMYDIIWYIYWWMLITLSGQKIIIIHQEIFYNVTKMIHRFDSLSMEYVSIKFYYCLFKSECYRYWEPTNEKQRLWNLNKHYWLPTFSYHISLICTNQRLFKLQPFVLFFSFWLDNV